jgi:phenylacetate-CoA ligase
MLLHRATGGCDVGAKDFGDTDVASFGPEERQTLVDAASKHLAHLMARPFLDHTRTRDQQTSRIAELLHIAYHTVPLYAKLFSDAGVTPANFKSLSDIRLFPIVRRDHLLTSTMVQAVSSTFSGKKTFETRSRGTSGTSLVVLFDLPAVIVDSLQGVRQLALQSSDGVSPSDLTVHYYAYPWWTNSIGKEWRSKFIPMDLPACYAADTCRRESPAVIAGYPTAIKRLMAATIPGEVSPKLIITNSEQSSRLERDQLSAHFNCTVLDEYSTEELTRVAIEMPDGLYYVHEDSVFLEIVDPRTGQPVEDGVWGEAVATGLLNEAMPFIRYATGDLVKRPKLPKSSWRGMGWSQLEAIGGRVQDGFCRQDNSIIPSGVIADLLQRVMVEHDISVADYQLNQLTPHKAQISFHDYEGRSVTHMTDLIAHFRSLLEVLMDCTVILEVSDHQSEGARRYAKRRPIRSDYLRATLSCSASSFKGGA